MSAGTGEQRSRRVEKTCRVSLNELISISSILANQIIYYQPIKGKPESEAVAGGGSDT